MKAYYIKSGYELMTLDGETGYIARADKGMASGSGDWYLYGAVRMNNFGHVVERRGLAETLLIKYWHHKNGAQKWHIADYDHGTRRVWMNPKHEIY